MIDFLQKDFKLPVAFFCHRGEDNVPGIVLLICSTKHQFAFNGRPTTCGTLM